MRKTTSLILGAMLLGTIAMTSCSQNAKQSFEEGWQATEKEKTQGDNKVAATALPETECKAFLESFYKGLEEADDTEVHIKKNVTKKALQTLIDAYDYECEGECIAFWLFSHDQEVGSTPSLTFERVEGDTYKVVNDYGDGYKYVVKIGLVKEGTDYKIDSIEKVVSGGAQ